MKEALKLVLGGTGKTGRRVAQGLQARGLGVRIGSRAAVPGFDWDDARTWPAALEGVDAVYIAYHPDLAAPGAPAAIQAFKTVISAASGPALPSGGITGWAFFSSRRIRRLCSILPATRIAPCSPPCRTNA